MSRSRKTNKAKRGSDACRNHGSCSWCRGNRTYQTRKELERILSYEKNYQEKLPESVTDFYDRMLIDPPPMSQMLLDRYSGRDRHAEI